MTKAETVTVSLVLVGEFQPDLFTIEKLKSAKAISASDQADYDALVREQVVSINLPWGRIAVTQDRFSIDTSQDPHIRVLDLASKCLREMAINPVVRQVGINVIAMYRLASFEARDTLGARLVPAANWGSWGRAIAESFKFPATDKRHGGAVSAVMRQGRTEDREAGWLDARVEPAVNDPACVYVSLNDHYEMQSSAASQAVQAIQKLENTQKLLGLMEERFETSIENSLKIAQGIIDGD